MSDHVGSDGRNHPPHTPRLIIEGELRSDWRNRSACRDEDPDIFFAVGIGAAAERMTADAKAICAGCDVIRECGTLLAHMQATLPGLVEGVWAGTSFADRNREARRVQSARERARKRERKQAAA